MSRPVASLFRIFAVFFLVTGIFLFGQQTLAAAPYCLCKWQSAFDKTPSISSDNKYSCIGVESGKFDKSGSEFGFVTDKDLQDKQISLLLLDDGVLECNGIPAVVTFKKLVSVEGLTCTPYPDKNTCSGAREQAIKQDDLKKQSCLCTGDNYEAKCVPNDGKECKSLISGGYTKCVLQDSASCVKGVGTVAQKEVMDKLNNENEFQAKKAVEAGVKKEFDRLGTTEPKVLIGRLINMAMGILGSLALAMFVYGGALWMTAAGEEARSEKARGVVLWAALGLMVIFASYAIIKMIFGAFE